VRAARWRSAFAVRHRNSHALAINTATSRTSARMSRDHRSPPRWQIIQTMGRDIRGPAASFVVALVIVTVATVAALFLEDPVAERQWPAVAAPIIPAVYLTVFLVGGPHGTPLSVYEAWAAIYGIALVMWWVVIEGSRQVWTFLRRDAHSPPV
jgi:hypothetical protein